MSQQSEILHSLIFITFLIITKQFKIYHQILTDVHYYIDIYLSGC